jgi:hypothetical protein
VAQNDGRLSFGGSDIAYLLPPNSLLGRPT